MFDYNNVPSTQAHEKVWNYYLEISKTDRFIALCKEARVKCGIPPTGYSTDDRSFYEKTGSESHRLFKLSCKICSDFKLTFLWADSIEQFILYNQIERFGELDDLGTCQVTNEMDIYKEPYGKWMGDNFNKNFPLSVRISPYASKRDILDYVDKMYSEFIAPLQKRYKRKDVKIGKVKTKKQSITTRNDIIYENRHMPYKEIFRLLPKEIRGNIDEGGIGKIISIENKKRKEV